MTALKRGLIVEGGGMRGAHSAGVLAELGCHKPPQFDLVIGSSAGACSVAFWVSKQFEKIETIWSQYVHGHQFIRYRNIIQSGAVMNLGYLIDEVFGQHEALDTQQILSSQQDFYITVTHCESGQAHYLHNKNQMDVLTALKAGAAMPLAHPLPVWYQGQPYADGGIGDAIPIQKALDEGCEELWIILTRPKGYRKKSPSKFPWPRWFFRRYPNLVEMLMTRYRHYNETLERIEELERQHRAYVVRPTDDIPLSRLTRNRRKLQGAIQQGRQDAKALLASI